MKLISHRGNTSGSNLTLENTPEQIKKVLNMGYDCEVDVHATHGGLFLGHDAPDHAVDGSFFELKSIWWHAKNLDALIFLLNKNVACFWHESDERTLTSNGYIWTYPGKAVNEKSIIVHLQNDWKQLNYNCYGICTDFI